MKAPFVPLLVTVANWELIDFTLTNARSFYSSRGDLLGSPSNQGWKTISFNPLLATVVPCNLLILLLLMQDNFTYLGVTSWSLSNEGLSFPVENVSYTNAWDPGRHGPTLKQPTISRECHLPQVSSSFVWRFPSRKGLVCPSIDTEIIWLGVI